MAYTDIDKPSDYFETVIYTGNGLNGRAVNTTESFAPDFVWCKSRNIAGGQHFLGDSVRGDGKLLSSESTAAEISAAGNGVSSTGAIWGDGLGVNGNGYLFANWFWKAGTSFTNDASATGIGSIDSAGSVNTDAGFSIISYTGTGSNGTVAHGLGVAPKMIICKGRSFSTSAHWLTYHEAMGNTSAMKLNLTSAKETTVYYWNNTSPTSSTFSLGASTEANSSSATFIAYCFAEKQGYSKFGSYTGNGNADGTFVYTGFKPAWVMVKNTVNNARNWTIIDNKRNPFNPEDEWLYANASDSTFDASSFPTDFVSNGFKIRNTGSYFNTSGENYIYMAFAENPFVTSTGVPATAR